MQGRTQLSRSGIDAAHFILDNKERLVDGGVKVSRKDVVEYLRVGEEGPGKRGRTEANRVFRTVGALTGAQELRDGSVEVSDDRTRRIIGELEKVEKVHRAADLFLDRMVARIEWLKDSVVEKQLIEISDIEKTEGKIKKHKRKFEARLKKLSIDWNAEPALYKLRKSRLLVKEFCDGFRPAARRLDADEMADGLQSMAENFKDYRKRIEWELLEGLFTD